MAYLHCHNCGWENDDFLEDYGGNSGYIKYFLGETLRELVKPDQEVPYPFTRKQMYKRFIKELKHLYWLNFKQEYKTQVDYEKKNPEHLCPKCGAKELDID